MIMIKLAMSAIFLIAAASAQAKTMECSSGAVKQIMTIENGKFDFEATLLSTGEVQSKSFDLSSLPSGYKFESDVFFSDNGIAGHLYDFNNCSKSEYRVIQGFAGPAGVRILANSTQSCVCN